MYFVDREKIEERLLFMEKQLELLKTQQHWETDLEKAALERIAHTIIEAILDTGNAMIDGFIMRDPGSYEDIVDILTDEQVITANFSDILKQVIACRKILVQQYEAVDHTTLIENIVRQGEQLATFPHAIRNYLVHELGPISAFKK
ncbi:DUF86 domain-containing protein [Lederbergia galactosidilytica]|uniref:DUF86 domain-containing protein n=1 Tax=Lederbergia galactosidilytica TaxID=217031 RepID=A0A177ZIQ8_9BACI|nr:DUF86 domain-containing protein [Lederbergia galactosidilytica]KRG15198.1 hypothetical protein ACA30_08535 [Virgibacillus soli]MBP1913142.1 uncharacterized protein YutE (UPF0331/DUF86 family) [Lederbergia galactosidilytica]OAK67836.1 hypothetical protein ABB05_17435 [Lederbergia galactosidilytica]